MSSYSRTSIIVPVLVSILPCMFSALTPFLILPAFISAVLLETQNHMNKFSYKINDVNFSSIVIHKIMLSFFFPKNTVFLGASSSGKHFSFHSLYTSDVTMVISPLAPYFAFLAFFFKHPIRKIFPD